MTPSHRRGRAIPVEVSCVRGCWALRLHRHELLDDAFQEELANIIAPRAPGWAAARDDGHGDAGAGFLLIIPYLLWPLQLRATD